MSINRSINGGHQNSIAPANVENTRNYQNYPSFAGSYNATNCGYNWAYSAHYGGCFETVTTLNQNNSSFKQRMNDAWWMDDVGNSVDGYFANAPAGGSNPTVNQNTTPNKQYMAWWYEPYYSAADYQLGFDSIYNSQTIYGVRPQYGGAWDSIISVGDTADAIYDYHMGNANNQATGNGGAQTGTS